MKKIILIFLTIILLTGCSLNLNRKTNNKTSYEINELATIDHYNIILEKYNEEQDDDEEYYLKTTFKITNNSTNKTHISNNDFKILNNIDNNYDIAINNFNVSLQSKETKEIEVEFKISRNRNYKILFYSNVVSNNISFEINK